MTEPTTKDLFKLLAPYLAGTALVAAVLGLGLQHLIPSSIGRAPSVASFDVIKYTNAQRAVASAFLKPSGDISRASEVLLKLPDRTRKAIADAAGPGTLVLLKQAVVQGQTRDITDEVLTKLGLPTNVPTADATAYTLDVAPTMLPSPTQSGAQRTPFAAGQQVLP